MLWRWFCLLFWLLLLLLSQNSTLPCSNNTFVVFFLLFPHRYKFSLITFHFTFYVMEWRMCWMLVLVFYTNRVFYVLIFRMVIGLRQSMVFGALIIAISMYVLNEWFLSMTFFFAVNGRHKNDISISWSMKVVSICFCCQANRFEFNQFVESLKRKIKMIMSSPKPNESPERKKLYGLENDLCQLDIHICKD